MRIDDHVHSRGKYMTNRSCEGCRDAHRAYVANWRAKVKGLEPPTHGAAGYINYSCRCIICTAANTEAGAKRRKGES